MGNLKKMMKHLQHSYTTLGIEDEVELGKVEKKADPSLAETIFRYLQKLF